MNYIREQIYICPDNQAALLALEASRIMLKLVWECQQAICALSNRNKVTLLWVHGHRGLQGDVDVDALARKGSSNTLLSPTSAIFIYELGGSR
jgi:ribonuclease HI